MQMQWRIHAASVPGTMHEEMERPCQDAHAHAARGEWLFAMVCDGAGSSVQGGEAAALVSQHMVERLSNLPPDVLASFCDALNETRRALLVNHLEAVRQKLAQRAFQNRQALTDFQCTVVGVMASAAGGLLFQIGDGCALARRNTRTTDDRTQCFVSPPENGEYANETYFLTDRHWRLHLRLTPITGEVDCIGLMSDGAMSFVANRALNNFSENFIAPVSHFLCQADSTMGNAALRTTLASDAAHAINGDDKTLLLAHWAAA